MSKARTVAVTGGASGIGAATVQRFLDSGDEVIVLDLQPNPRAHRNIEVDLSKPSSIEAAAAQIGPIDVLCNVAGVSGSAPVPVVMSVNFLGLRLLTDLVADNITAGGAVVSVASTAGWYWRDHLDDVNRLIDTPDYSNALSLTSDLVADGYHAYVRSKEAVIVWTSHAAQRYLGRFRVNSISPGPVETPLLPSFYESMGHEELDPLTKLAGGRNGRPEEIAAAIHFLAGAEASWINGTDLVVDGGAEMAFSLQQPESVTSPATTA
ncbi:SDR family oxidoreductase [Rhodococcus sp. NPDC057529]|uniref:SDR family oxidoreductase n=1 Tax=Rhodococcus sp. NPDC057529 TaxID=3346158 RepID=UPI003671A3E6